MSNNFPHLLAPGRIGKLELRNRMIVTAMGVNLAETDGTCSERIRAFHEEQAKGGVAAVIVGVCGVAWPVGGNQPNQVAISDDKFIPGLAAMGDAIHAHGAKFCIQLHHGGPVGVMDMIAGRPLWVPSLPQGATNMKEYMNSFLLDEIKRMPSSKITQAPQFKALTTEDIRTVIEQFAAGAVRARKAGADGVEIHGGHGYLLSSFVSPRSNRRTDEYGGSLENRVRLLLEVTRAVKAAVGNDLAVWVKLDSKEFGVTTGITIEDAILTAKMLEAAGADAITVSSYHDTTQPKLHSGSNIPHVPGLNIPAAEAIKAAVAIPVIASGRVEPELGEEKIAQGSFDFLGMGRKLLADPFLPGKLKEGRRDAVRPCIYCYTCVSAIYTGDPTRCAVNPETAFEFQRRTLQAPARKRYVVIGGGPGGMEAACRLEAQGHQVIMLEKGERLGGTLQFAAIVYEPNERLLNWLRRNVAASKIEVRLDTVATPELLRELKPDAIFVATGVVRDMPPIPGTDLPHVFSGDDMRRLVTGVGSPDLARKVGGLTRLATRIGAATGITSNLPLLRQISQWWMPLGKNIVIVGGELVGLELAEFLMERGRTVSVVDEIPRFGKGLLPVRRMRLLAELKEHGVGLFAEAKDIRITAKTVSFTDKDGAAQAIPADHVIAAKGAHGDTTLADELRAAGFTVHAFGDCTSVTYIEGAMRGAAEAVAALNS